MRKLIISILAITVLFLLLPFGFGLHTQFVLNELNGLRIPLKEGELGAIEIAVLDQHRGWFNSSATLQLSYEHPSAATAAPNADTPEAKAAAVTFLVSELQVLHGPVLWRTGHDEKAPLFGQSLIIAPIKYAAENFSDRFIQITGETTGHLISYINFLGNQKVLLDTNEISFNDNKGQINFSGLNMVIDRFVFDNEVAFLLNIPHLNFIIYGKNEESSGIRWVVNHVNVEFDGILDTLNALWFGTWVGELAATVEDFQFEMNGEHYAFSQLGTAALQKRGANPELLEGRGEMVIENVTVEQQILGPIELVFNYENVDKKSVEYIRGAYNRWLYSDSMEPFVVSLSPQEKVEFYDHLFTFVNYLPHYQISEFSMITPQGDVNADISVQITTPATSVEQLEHATYWQQNVSVLFDLETAQPVMQNSLAYALQKFYGWLNPLFPAMHENAPAVNYHDEAMNLLSQAAGLGVIKPVGNDYISAVKYQQGILTINDQTMLDWSKPESKLATP